MALASSVYIVNVCAPFTGLGPLLGSLVVGDVPAVVIIVLLARSLRRPASRRPRWHLAFVLLAVALPCIAAARGATYPAYGSASGILTGIVAPCSPAEQKAAGGLDTSPIVSVSVQNQAGQTVASQTLPLRTSGARYRIKLPRGTYSITAGAGGGSGYTVGDTVYVPAGGTNEEDFNDSGACV
jgi:hypothetical protein